MLGTDSLGVWVNHTAVLLVLQFKTCCFLMREEPIETLPLVHLLQPRLKTKEGQEDLVQKTKEDEEVQGKLELGLLVEEQDNLQDKQNKVRLGLQTNKDLLVKTEHRAEAIPQELLMPLKMQRGNLKVLGL